MNELEILNIGGVDCYEVDGIAFLKLETVARGLGFTDEHNGIEYIRWARVDKYLADFGFATSGERPEYIPENIFYRLAMKAKNETAEKFQALVADEIIPTLRRTGRYAVRGAVPEYSGMVLDNYMSAARTIAMCPRDRLPIVVDLIRKAGIDVDTSATRASMGLLPEEAQTIRERASAAIRKVREAGKTFAGIGDAIGCNRSQVYKYCNGSCPNTARAADVLERLEKAFPELFGNDPLGDDYEATRDG